MHLLVITPIRVMLSFALRMKLMLRTALILLPKKVIHPFNNLNKRITIKSKRSCQTTSISKMFPKT